MVIATAAVHRVVSGVAVQTVIPDARVQGIVAAAPVQDISQEGAVQDVVIRAALAPAEPSSQDLAIARQAQSERTKAQAELSKKREVERQQATGDDETARNAGDANSSAQADPRLQEALTAYQQTTGASEAASLFNLIAGQEGLSLSI